MKRFYQILLLSFYIIAISIQAQQDETFKKIIELGKTDNKAMEHLDYLCNVFGGRQTGSDAFTNSANWALDQFKSWGMQAELDEAGEVQIGFNRGPWFGKMISPSEKYLEFGTPAYTAGTKGKQKGHVIISPSSIELLVPIKEKIKGAWILIEGENNGYPRDRDSVSSFTKKLIEFGALGTIQLAKIPFRLFDDRNVTSWDNLPKLPDIKLIDHQYNEIKELIQNGKEVILEFDIRNHFSKGPIKYHNVIGWIPGTEFPDEYVILGAHLDSYDHATGAVDNGSGSARMMEAIRLLAASGAKPRRTIMIHLYAAEERGLLGSKAWVKNHKDKLEKISVMLNHDSGTNPVVSLNVPKVMYDVLKPVIEPIEKIELKYPFKFIESRMFRKAGRGGTDSHSFIMEGVPVPWLRTEGPHKYGTTWHTTIDTYDQVIPDAQEQSALVIALIAYQIANFDQLLPREGAFLPDGIYADLNTNKGRITLKLDYENVPMTTANFIGLTEGRIKNDAFPDEKPYFKGTIWHRVVPGHVIQAGMPATTDTLEGPGYEFPNEIYSGLSHNKAGMLGMANAGPNTNGSQFYITLGDRSYLDGNYTLFGYVVEGMDVVNQIVQRDTIKSVNITRIGENANNFIVTDESFRKMVDDEKEKVKMNYEKRMKDEAEWINNNYPGLTETPNGIKYKILKEGTGEKPVQGDSLKVKYSGKVLIDKLSFVSTADEGKPDFGDTAQEFIYRIGTTKINPGFDEMITEMKRGEKRIVILPAELGYGINNGFYGKYETGKKRFVISPNSTLYYEIEIM